MSYRTTQDTAEVPSLVVFHVMRREFQGLVKDDEVSFSTLNIPDFTGSSIGDVWRKLLDDSIYRSFEVLERVVQLGFDDEVVEHLTLVPQLH